MNITKFAEQHLLPSGRGVFSSSTIDILDPISRQCTSSAWRLRDARYWQVWDYEADHTYRAVVDDFGLLRRVAA